MTSWEEEGKVVWRREGGDWVQLGSRGRRRLEGGRLHWEDGLRARREGGAKGQEVASQSRVARKGGDERKEAKRKEEAAHLTKGEVWIGSD